MRFVIKSNEEMLTVTLLGLTVFLLVACAEKNKRELPPLPKEDGIVLYNFLLKEIPEVVSLVPCSCCGKKLDWCYKGGCPPTCGPCNREGRLAYQMYKNGAAEEEILAAIYKKYFSPK